MKDALISSHLGRFEIDKRRGFLPPEDPPTTFGDHAHPDLEPIKKLGQELPELLESHRLRSVLDRLEPIGLSVFDSLNEREQILAARIYAFLTSAYVHQLGEPKVSKIPRNLAVPFHYLSRKLGRSLPILSYDLYALNNWRRLATSAQIEAKNMDTIQKFVRIKDESWFILIHVEIEAKAAPAVAAIGASQQAVYEDDPVALQTALETINASLADMISTLKRMPEGNNPDVYAFSFRPYIQMFQGVSYEGVDELQAPPTFRGETGAQSSIVPSLDVALGINHARTDLTDYVLDMRKYMPKKHREFIEAVEGIEKAQPVRTYIVSSTRRPLKEAYNSCLDKINEFRQQHLEFAILYVHTKVTDPSGTGGTPFLKWLAQLRDETRAAKIRG